MQTVRELPGGHPLGIHRVLESSRGPGGTLPQAATRLDNDLSRMWDNELLLEVERINIDSASFRQMEEAGDVAAQVRATVAARGKQHNSVTGSGGMLLGRVAQLGSRLGATGLAVGDRVATLVSLTLTPLALDRIVAVDAARHQVAVEGRAVLFASGAFARLDEATLRLLPEGAFLAALDVAGAAPQVARLVAAAGPAARVLVLGCGGKSGLLVSAAARRAGAAQVIGLEQSAAAAAAARRLDACEVVLEADAADAVAVEVALAATGGPVDLTVSCVNAPDAEMAAILATRDGGRVYFFSMATSFTRAALGAEGVSRDVEMLVGNGYCRGHAEATLDLLRSDERLRALFVERYG
jgi:L-erythro-3,5-diaminohexanoate dehydrogenase